jgi:hypothetical protein
LIFSIQRHSWAGTPTKDHGDPLHRRRFIPDIVRFPVSMGEEPSTPWPYQQQEETTIEATSLLTVMAEDELMGAYYIGDVDESSSSNFLPDPSCFGGGGGCEDSTPILEAFPAVVATEGRIASTDPCFDQQQGTTIEDRSHETTVGGAAVTDETEVEEKESSGALSPSDDALPGHCSASSLQETQNESVHVVVDEIEEADKVKAVEGHNEFAGVQQRLLQPTMETADSHSLAWLDDGSERDSNERHSLTATVNEPLIAGLVDARPAVLDMASTLDPPFVDAGSGNDEPPRQQAQPVVDDDDAAAAVALEVLETPIAITTASGVVTPPTDPTNASSSMFDNEGETMDGIEDDTNDDDGIDRSTAHHHWPETTLIDTSAPLDCPTHALCNDATETANDGTENVGDGLETAHEHRTDHQLDSSSSSNNTAEIRAATGEENDDETKNVAEEQEEAVNTADIAVEMQVMIRNADHDPAVAGADDDDDGECCTALLSDLVEEADLALEELLGDDFDGAPVVAVPKKTGIVVPAKARTVCTTGPTKQSSDSSSSSVVRTSISKVAARSKQRLVTTSRPFGNKKQLSSSPQVGEFKARPLPKYLSQGPPKLNLKEFKPTVQVPFRLRTEERFLGRPANCACCIAKRNALLSSLSSSHKQHNRSGPSPTDVTEDFATGKAAPITTVIAPDKPTCSPVRPIKLEERFQET